MVVITLIIYILLPLLALAMRKLFDFYLESIVASKYLRNLE